MNINLYMTKVFFNQLHSTLKGMETINSDDRYFEGFLTVQMKDKQGEITIVDELYKVLPIWIDRGAPISDTHTNRIIGRGINYSKTTVKNSQGEDLPAIKITGKIFKNYELDNMIWDKIKSGEYKGLSFGGATKSSRTPLTMKDGSMAYALSDLEHYEVAVCKDPAVPMALITDFNPVAKANFNTFEKGDGRMVIQCSKFGCYVDKNDDVIKNDKKYRTDLSKYRTSEGKVEVLKSIAEKLKGNFDAKTGKINIKQIMNKDPSSDETQVHITSGGKVVGTGGNKTLQDIQANQKKQNYKRKDDRSIPPSRVPNNEGYTKLNNYKEDGFKNRDYFIDNTIEDDDDEIYDYSSSDLGNKIGYKYPESEDGYMSTINIHEAEKLKANLTNIDTFQGKVNALVREGKRLKNAKRIVGAFVHNKKSFINWEHGGKTCPKCKQKITTLPCAECGYNKKSLDRLKSILNKDALNPKTEKLQKDPTVPSAYTGDQKPKKKFRLPNFNILAPKKEKPIINTGGKAPTGTSNPNSYSGTQNIIHSHIHLIPRKVDDIKNPEGGEPKKEKPKKTKKIKTTKYQGKKIIEGDGWFMRNKALDELKTLIIKMKVTNDMNKRNKKITSFDHSNSDGELLGAYNQNVGKAEAVNSVDGVRNNFNPSKQGGLEEEETNEISHI